MAQKYKCIHCGYIGEDFEECKVYCEVCCSHIADEIICPSCKERIDLIYDDPKYAEVKE